MPTPTILRTRTSGSVKSNGTRHSGLSTLLPSTPPVAHYIGPRSHVQKVTLFVHIEARYAGFFFFFFFEVSPWISPAPTQAQHTHTHTPNCLDCTGPFFFSGGGGQASDERQPRSELSARGGTLKTRSLCCQRVGAEAGGGGKGATTSHARLPRFGEVLGVQ